MQKELADKWANALESGNYEQGYGTLKTEDDKYCCWGVYCEISPLLKSAWEADPLVSGAVDLGVLGVKNPYGILPFLDRQGKTVILTELNDSGVMSFKQIAQLIRHFYEDL
jgi:hypothetical protein